VITLSSKSLSFFWVYNHGLLKTLNEVVVECMCKVVGKHAEKGKGLHVGRCAMCMHVYVIDDDNTVLCILTLYHDFFFVDMLMRHVHRGMHHCNM